MTLHVVRRARIFFFCFVGVVCLVLIASGALRYTPETFGAFARFGGSAARLIGVTH
jgi:hypothetical protein